MDCHIFSDSHFLCLSPFILLHFISSSYLFYAPPPSPPPQYIYFFIIFYFTRRKVPEIFIFDFLWFPWSILKEWGFEGNWISEGDDFIFGTVRFLRFISLSELSGIYVGCLKENCFNFLRYLSKECLYSGLFMVTFGFLFHMRHEIKAYLNFDFVSHTKRVNFLVLIFLQILYIFYFELLDTIFFYYCIRKFNKKVSFLIIGNFWIKKKSTYCKCNLIFTH